MSTDMIALVLAGAAILCALPGAIWTVRYAWWAVRR